MKSHTLEDVKRALIASLAEENGETAESCFNKAVFQKTIDLIDNGKSLHDPEMEALILTSYGDN